MPLLENIMTKTYQIEITGLVQGVGFRPFVYRLAKQRNLTGNIQNTNKNVLIRVNINMDSIESLIESIRKEAPAAATIKNIIYKEIEGQLFTKFEIIQSKILTHDVTEVSPDIAVCDECLEDMKSQPHRLDYPFINCTNCGPRFTIVKELPYDRKNTTMDIFPMCSDCSGEYSDVLDRRFHAQPVACQKCGPEYQLNIGNEYVEGIANLLNKTSKFLKDGKVLAIKGLGGYFIACDATNEKAVKKLRDGKKRYGKPFAVMFRDIESVKEYTHINEKETELITSWRRPIVLIESKKSLASDVTRGFSTIGAMLPYMPFHYLLFETLDIPALVFTSGNLSEEPITIDNLDAIQKLGSITDVTLTYNRDVQNRVDDSVTMCVNNKEHIIRRSRGYAPKPIDLSIPTEGILAAGAELVNCFCIGKGTQALLSQHIGDLKTFETYQFYTESIERYKRLFQFSPELVVCDMHPDYLSTKYAKEMDLPIIEVQHHHAHIAAAMAEYGLDEKVIGISFDGTGLGADGNIWGGEVLVCDLLDFERVTHLENVPLPGGDKAIEEPWRMALSYLYNTFNEDVRSLNLPFLKDRPSDQIDLIYQAIDKNINSPLTSSCGRLFDAVAAMLNLCTYSQFHAEAPMRLESILKKNCKLAYDFQLEKDIKTGIIIRQIVDDINASKQSSLIATKFHNTIINVIFAVVNQLSSTTGIKKVVLSGGTFQNRYLIEHLENDLQKNNYEVYIPGMVPSNDGGIALGQMAIAAKRRKQ